MFQNSVEYAIASPNKECCRIFLVFCCFIGNLNLRRKNYETFIFLGFTCFQDDDGNNDGVGNDGGESDGNWDADNEVSEFCVKYDDDDDDDDVGDNNDDSEGDIPSFQRFT